MHFPEDSLYLVDGGIGDFLQFVPFMLKYKRRYFVLTHFKGAKELMLALNVTHDTLMYYSTEPEKVEKIKQIALNNTISQCPRHFYFEGNPFPIQKPLFNNGKKTIGVHLNGSKFSLEWQIAHNMITKSIPPKIIKSFKDYNVIVFGLPEDLEGLEESDHVKLIFYKDIAKSFAYVEQCDYVVAADSSVKTMSSMLRIPTFVWMADNIDDFRDKIFIDQYVKDGIMKTFKYKDAFAEFDEGIKQTMEFLNESKQSN